MGKYRKKPIVVDARGPLTESEIVTTAHGRVRAEAGDYILSDPATRDTWPIKPDIFAATYEAVEPSAPEPKPEPKCECPFRAGEVGIKNSLIVSGICQRCGRSVEGK